MEAIREENWFLHHHIFLSMSDNKTKLNMVNDKWFLLQKISK